MKLIKGDKVKITKGKDRGKEGAIEKVWVKEGKVTITGLNLYKRHIKPRGEGQKGQILTLARPLPVGNVALICPKCKEPTRIGFKINRNEKVRICRKCEGEI